MTKGINRCFLIVDTHVNTYIGYQTPQVQNAVNELQVCSLLHRLADLQRPTVSYFNVTKETHLVLEFINHLLSSLLNPPG